jgi:hypothetical protein
MTLNIVTLRIMALNVVTLRIMALNIVTIRIMTLNIVTFGTMTLRIAIKNWKLCITSLRIMPLYVECCCDKHLLLYCYVIVAMLRVVMLSNMGR